MELTIDGIGKVCDTRILLEGITLVAGPNNIGKSTIGKTLFALVNSQYDFTARMLREKISKTEQAIYRYLSAKEKLSYQLVDYLSGTIRMIDAVLVACCIALGVGIVLSAFQMLTGITLL